MNRAYTIEYANEHNINYTKGHKTEETNYVKLTSNMKLKAQINSKYGAYI